jgi:hypothetical protein
VSPASDATNTIPADANALNTTPVSRRWVADTRPRTPAIA